MAVYEDDRDVTYEILEEIGIISTQDTGWTREINLVRWNGGVAKYDIRDWDPYHERMSKGITLTEDEMRRMLNAMRKRRSNARNRRTVVRAETVVSTEEVSEALGAGADDGFGQPAASDVMAASDAASDADVLAEAAAEQAAGDLHEVGTALQ